MKNIILKFGFLFCSFSPTVLLAQIEQPKDFVEDSIWRNDCENRTFYKVEYLPYIKGGIKKMEDSLAFYMKSYAIFKNTTYFKLSFTVSASTRILSLKIEDTNFPKPQLLEKFIKSSGNMWKSAIQNGRPVCAKVYFTGEIIDDKLTLTITQ